MKRLLLLTTLLACGGSTAPKAVDNESCVFAKEAVWLSQHHHLPVPDSLMSSNVWNIDTRWWLGDETTTFTATTQGCLVVNH